MTSISHSRVDAYLSCRRKEFYGYSRKLQRVETSTGLALGSAGHEALAVLYSTVLAAGTSLVKQRKAYPDAVKAMWAHVDKTYKEGFEDGDRRAPLRLILEKYLQREPFIDRTWADDKRQYLILAVEKEFNLEYDPENGGQYPFVVDLIVRDPEKRFVVVDHKFVYDFYRYEATELMPQIPKYIGALRALGYKVAGYGFYNMIRTRPDTKAGRPLDEWSFNMDIQVSGQRVQRSFQEQIDAALELEELDELDEETRDRKAWRVGNSMVCQGCPFKELCSTELRGGNVEVLLRSEYKVKEKRAHIEVSEEVDS